jgi:Uma2 family endonuclease
MSAKTLISVAEFDRLEEEEFRYELDEGELITMTRPNTDHGRVERRLLMVLQTHLENSGSGEAFGSNILFVLGPNTKRAPDVSVVFREVGSVKEINGAPDIAVEILSLSNAKKEMQRKLEQFFAAGCKLSWIIDPKTRTVEVWESASTPSRTLVESDMLDTPLLPGLTCPIVKLFT